MYPVDMKTVTITIPEDLDRRAAQEARRRGISKSQLIRQGLDAVLPEPADGDGDDPWRSRAGFGPRGLRVAPGEIDEVVYGT
jgi:predicted transcriptional regulator